MLALKVVLTASSDIFRNMLTDSKNNEIELKHPRSIVEPIFDWMHSVKLFNWENIDVSDIFTILKFAEQYAMPGLKKSISNYFGKKLNSGTLYFNIVEDVLTSYKHDNIGKDIYNKAIKDVIWMRRIINDTSHADCDEENCCEDDENDCENIRTRVRRVGPLYLSIMKKISAQVHVDIAIHEVS